jgi:hypothetical protein
MPEKKQMRPKLAFDVLIVAVAGLLLFGMSYFGVEAGQTLHKGAGNIVGAVYLYFLSTLFLLSYLLPDLCYTANLIRYVCDEFSHPRGRKMALFYFGLCFVIGTFVLLVALGVL